MVPLFCFVPCISCRAEFTSYVAKQIVYNMSVQMFWQLCIVTNCTVFLQDTAAQLVNSCRFYLHQTYA
jgi:hypothetical protein